MNTSDHSLQKQKRNYFTTTFIASKKRIVWSRPLQKGDIVGCTLDLNIPQIHFTVNGQPTSGLFKNFNIDGYFFPVMSLSAKVRLATP